MKLLKTNKSSIALALLIILTIIAMMVFKEYSKYFFWTIFIEITFLLYITLINKKSLAKGEVAIGKKGFFITTQTVLYFFMALLFLILTLTNKGYLDTIYLRINILLSYFYIILGAKYLDRYEIICHEKYIIIHGKTFKFYRIYQTTITEDAIEFYYFNVPKKIVLNKYTADVKEKLIKIFDQKASKLSEYLQD
ncbi:hypothetical protein [Saccharicrinis sp. FJH54]|uniref:hypothetical protein n=1 Tax=Saccharicrinis sp. FJH54 TaxID=3344665 RepID=UPI0035D3FDA8